MTLLRRANIPKPSLRKETVEVPELGGAVVVRGTMLDERLALVFGAAPPAGEQLQGKDEPEPEDPRERFQHIARLLAYAVIDADGVPVYTAEEWAEFGGEHFGAVLRLYAVAKRLSGMDPDEAKKNS